MNNYRLTIAYDGSRYNGWQRQGNTKNTVQEKIENVLSEMLGHKIEIHGSGRTDAGAHALGQVASFAAETEKTPDEIKRELNRYLPDDIAATDACIVPERFHARLSAKEKVYVYRIWTRDYPNVFRRKYMYNLGKLPDLEKMRTAAALLETTADFIGYSSLKKAKKSTVRTIYSIGIELSDGELSLTFRGNGFLYNMVRIISGTLLEAGMGKRSPESVADALKTLSRADAGETLPACGLTLLEVIY